MQTFGTILVDPPWDYHPASNHNQKNRGYVTYRNGKSEYPVLTPAALRALPVGPLAGPDSVLLLWTAKGFLPDGLALLAAWGFTYKTYAIWGKTRRDGGVHGGGVGYWLRGATEMCLFGARGKAVRTGEPDLHLSGKIGHSSKPTWLHEMAERHFNGPYLELFGRRARAGWTVLGDEAPGDGTDIRDSIRTLTNPIPT